MKKRFLYAAMCANLCLPVPSWCSEVDTFHSKLIQGDVKGALQTAQLIAAAGLPAKDAAAFACMRARFGMPPAAASGPGASVLDAYRAYWHAVLLAQQSRAGAEAQLLKTLNGILPGAGWDRASLNDTMERTRLYLENQGLHALLGVTRPNHELMLWSKEDTQTYRLVLPEQEVAVRVVFIDGFLSKGWLSYASCGRLGAGGWTAAGTLYALAGSYDTGSEHFRTSYLGHEGQHFADNIDFPNLEQSELEYRAKLTEIVLSADPRERLGSFEKNARAGRSVPHSHAQFWLVRRLRERAPVDAGADTLRAAARSLLVESSAQARTAGAATVTQLLPD